MKINKTNFAGGEYTICPIQRLEHIIYCTPHGLVRAKNNVGGSQFDMILDGVEYRGTSNPKNGRKQLRRQADRFADQCAKIAKGD